MPAIDRASRCVVVSLAVPSRSPIRRVFETADGSASVAPSTRVDGPRFDVSRTFREHRAHDAHRADGYQHARDAIDAASLQVHESLLGLKKLSSGAATPRASRQSFGRARARLEVRRRPRRARVVRARVVARGRALARRDRIVDALSDVATARRAVFARREARASSVAPSAPRRSCRSWLDAAMCGAPRRAEGGSVRDAANARADANANASSRETHSVNAETRRI